MTPIRLAAAGLVLLATPALAQAPAQAPAWAQGRPDSMANSPLAPHAPKLTVTPPNEVPVDRLRVPQGFKAELWAHGLPGGRAMAIGDKGTVFVGTRAIGRVYAISTEGGERRVRVIAERLTQPSGVAFRDGSLYVLAINQVLRYDGIEDKLDNPGQPTDLTAAFNLPPDQHHGWKYATFGQDGRLYTAVGVPCNICTFDRDRYALLVSFRPDGSDRRIEARGIRNSVGQAVHPVTGELWATNNGRDWAGNDVPPDTLHRVRRSGEDHGFPYCVGSWADPEVQGRACSEFEAPAALLGGHTAAMAVIFYTGTMFPEAYRNQAFIARRGSWNRERMQGYDVVVANIDAQGRVTAVEPFMTGLLDEQAQKFHGRPVGLLQLPDGSLLVSDEQMGAIYRISHGG